MYIIIGVYVQVRIIKLMFANTSSYDMSCVSLSPESKCEVNSNPGIAVNLLVDVDVRTQG